MYSTEVLHAPPVRPIQVTIIALVQFLKAAILILIPTLGWLDPNATHYSPALTQIVYVASRGRELPGILMPLIGFYVAFLGMGLWKLRPGARRNVLLGSLFTIMISLARLGVFDTLLGLRITQSPAEQQTVMIIILFDAAIFLYLAFHHDITLSFRARH